MSVKEESIRYTTNMRISGPAEATRVKEAVDLYTVFWMFVVGSVAGYVVETIFAFIKTGHYQNRSSMLVSPFNVIYGVGALVLYIGLHMLSSKKNHSIFLFGMVSGTAIEFFASWAQQAVFGSVSWDYSILPLNIGGRVSLLFAFFWGTLAILWVKVFQPLLERMIAAIPKQIGKHIAVCLLALLVSDMLISAIAVARWGTRLDGVPAGSAVVEMIDRVFPDAFMQKVYASMKHIQ